MYEDSWYSFVPDAPKDDSHAQAPGHRRRQSLLSQPNERDHEGHGQTGTLDPLFEGGSSIISPPTATLVRRAKSYTDFYHVVRAQITKDAKRAKKEERETEIPAPTTSASLRFEKTYESYEYELLEASQEEFQVYRDQLALSERHLQGLLENTTSALDLLAALSDSFKAVETHTAAFQAQCEDLLTEKELLKRLGDEVSEGLKFYSFLEPITRRLNSPGASRAIGDDSFVEILGNLDSCIDYMTSHPAERESEVYLTRYRSLLARTLNLLRLKFGDLIRENTAQALKRVSADKMTMTNAFLVQAPQTSAIGKEMEGFMGKLCDIAFRLYDPYRDIFRLSEAKPYEGDYLDAFKSFIVEYATERQKIVPILLDKLLDLADGQRSAGDLARWARDSIQTILEIVTNEDSKYAETFLSHAPSSDGEEQRSSKAFTYRGPFQTFLLDIVNKGCIAMQPILDTMDIPTTIELVTWLRTHYDLSSLMDGEGDDDAATANTVPRDAELKSRLSNLFKEAISKIVFSRMNEILLREIEKYSPKPEDLVARPSAIIPSRADELDGEVLDAEGPVTSGIDVRAAHLLGPGLSNAYPPVKTAVRLLMIFNDLTHDSKAEEAANEIAYNIMHQTCQAIMRAAEQVTAGNSQVDGSIFAIKNLVLLKNVVLAYEISGSRRAASINFDQMWATFEALRSRGELFNVQAYYKLLWNGQLLPQVVENVEDARLELDGLMRTTITRFREECADKLISKKSRSRVKDAWTVEADLKEKLKIMFSEEKELRENLWAAVEETVASKRL